MSEERAVTLEDLVFIRSAVIAHYGGASDIRDAGSLEAAAVRNLALSVVAHRIGAEELSAWFKEHTRPA